MKILDSYYDVFLIFLFFCMFALNSEVMTEYRCLALLQGCVGGLNTAAF